MRRWANLAKYLAKTFAAFCRRSIAKRKLDFAPRPIGYIERSAFDDANIVHVWDKLLNDGTFEIINEEYALMVGDESTIKRRAVLYAGEKYGSQAQRLIHNAVWKNQDRLSLREYAWYLIKRRLVRTAKEDGLRR